MYLERINSWKERIVKFCVVMRWFEKKRVCGLVVMFLKGEFFFVCVKVEKWGDLLFEYLLCLRYCVNIMLGMKGWIKMIGFVFLENLVLCRNVR